MYPVLLRIGRLTIYSYGVLMALAILAALLLLVYRGKKRGLNQDALVDIALYGIIGGFLGAKLLYLISEAPYIIKNPASIWNMLTGGFVVYGAIIGGVLSGYIYCRTKGFDFLKYFDLAAPSLALAQGIGRIGCLTAGCCYGRETTSHFSIIFKQSIYAPNNVKLIPTQIISSIGDFLIALVLIIFASKPRKNGQIAGLYMLLYSIGRFFIEFLRNDPRGNVGLLSTSQFICIFILIGGIIILYKEKIKAPASHN